MRKKVWYSNNGDGIYTPTQAIDWFIIEREREPRDKRERETETEETNVGTPGIVADAAGLPSFFLRVERKRWEGGRVYILMGSYDLLINLLSFATNTEY